jgi:hypothetical protein
VQLAKYHKCVSSIQSEENVLVPEALKEKSKLRPSEDISRRLRDVSRYFGLSLSDHMVQSGIQTDGFIDIVVTLGSLRTLAIFM